MSKEIKYNQAEKEFYDKAIVWSNTLLFYPTIAINFISRCKELNLIILGIDAFRKKNDKIQPDLEHCIDYTNKQNKGIEDPWAAAIDFIKQREN